MQFFFPFSLVIQTFNMELGGNSWCDILIFENIFPWHFNSNIYIYIYDFDHHNDYAIFNIGTRAS